MNFKLLTFDNIHELETTFKNTFMPILQELAACKNFPSTDTKDFYYEREVRKMLELGLGNLYDQAQYDVTKTLINDIYIKLTTDKKYLGYQKLSEVAPQNYTNEILAQELQDFMWPILDLGEDKAFAKAVNEAFNEQIPALINKNSSEKTNEERTHLYFIAITTTFKVLANQNN